MSQALNQWTPSYHPGRLKTDGVNAYADRPVPVSANKNEHIPPISHGLQVPPETGDIPSIIRYDRAAYGTVTVPMLNEEYCHSFPVDDVYERSRE